MHCAAAWEGKAELVPLPFISCVYLYSTGIVNLWYCLKTSISTFAKWLYREVLQYNGHGMNSHSRSYKESAQPFHQPWHTASYLLGHVVTAIRCQSHVVLCLSTWLCPMPSCSILHWSLTSFISFQPPTPVLSIIPNIECLIIQALSILLVSKEIQLHCRYLLHLYSVQLTCPSTYFVHVIQIL